MNQLFQTHHKVCLNMVLYDKIENYALGLFVAVASDISTRSSMRVFRQNYSRPTIEFGRWKGQFEPAQFRVALHERGKFIQRKVHVQRVDDESWNKFW